jgi:hypothetical protein
MSVDRNQQAIDYGKLLVRPLARLGFEKLTRSRPHVLLRPGMFISHKFTLEFVQVIPILLQVARALPIQSPAALAADSLPLAYSGLKKSQTFC